MVLVTYSCSSHHIGSDGFGTNSNSNFCYWQTLWLNSVPKFAFPISIKVIRYSSQSSWGWTITIAASPAHTLLFLLDYGFAV